MDEQTFKIGDYVSWGNPGSEQYGIIMTFSHDGKIAYLKRERYNAKNSYFQVAVSKLHKERKP